MITRAEVLEYIQIAAEERIRARVKWDIEELYPIKQSKYDIEYYESVIKYIEENLK